MILHWQTPSDNRGKLCWSTSHACCLANDFSILKACEFCTADPQKNSLEIVEAGRAHSLLWHYKCYGAHIGNMMQTITLEISRGLQPPFDDVKLVGDMRMRIVCVLSRCFFGLSLLD
jgi:hypothetical protein